MEYNGYYSSDHKNRDSEGRGGNTFATIVIIVVIVLLALMVIGLFAPNLLGISPTDTLVNATPTPSMTQQADITPTPEPGATAAPDGMSEGDQFQSTRPRGARHSAASSRCRK